MEGVTLALDAADMPADAIEVGRITDAWGVKGWFKVLPYSASPEALFSSKRWFLMPTERGAATFAGPVMLRVQEAKDHAGSVVACAQAIPDRSAAEALKGARIFIARSSFPTAAQDEYYWVDLIGLDVVNRQGECLGTVRDLMSTGPQAVLVIEQRLADKTVELMVPFVAAFIDNVDLPARRISVDWQSDY